MTKELKGINTFKVFIKEFECEGDYHGWFKYHSYGLVDIGDESLHCDVDKFIDPLGIKDSISYIYILKNQCSKDRRNKIVKYLSSFNYKTINAKIIDRRNDYDL